MEWKHYICAYSMLILVLGNLETKLNALLDKRSVAGQGLVLQRSTTSTTMEDSLHGLLRPLKHLSLYRLPHAAPLSQSPLLAATKRPPSGSSSLLYPGHLVAANYR